MQLRTVRFDLVVTAPSAARSASGSTCPARLGQLSATSKVSVSVALA